MLDFTAEIISEEELPSHIKLNETEISSELEKIHRGWATCERLIQKLIKKVELITEENESFSKELNQKRKRIIDNRERISSVRADLSIWTK
mgnify:CR=1 FL=1